MDIPISTAHLRLAKYILGRSRLLPDLGFRESWKFSEVPMPTRKDRHGSMPILQWHGRRSPYPFLYDMWTKIRNRFLLQTERSLLRKLLCEVWRNLKKNGRNAVVRNIVESKEKFTRSRKT
ncbi:hypothetical protein Trydic_g13231 [Trypoxylus dichotomus]